MFSGLDSPRLIARIRRAVPQERWKRNHLVFLVVVVGAQFGFYIANPFLPLYVRELGVTDVAAAALWSGVLIGASPLMGSFCAPFLGIAADRFGDRRVVVAMTLSFTILLLAMAFVSDVWQLLALRLLNGVVGGLSPLALAITVSIAPAGEVAYVVGTMSAAQFLPLAGGPALGSAVAGSLGLRATFVAGALFCLTASIVLATFFQPSRSSTAIQPRTRGDRIRELANALRTPGLAMPLVSLFALQFGETSWYPVLPLRLSQITGDIGAAQAGTGVLYTLGAVSYVIGAWGIPRIPLSDRLRLVLVLSGALVSFGVAGASEALWQIAFARTLTALYAGATVALAYAIAVARLGDPESKAVLGLVGASAMLGRAVSPFASGVVAQIGLPVVFYVDASLCLMTLAMLFLADRRPGSPAVSS